MSLRHARRLTRRRLVNRLFAVAWLAAIWVVLTGSYDLAAVVGGVVLGATLVLAFRGERRHGIDAFRPIPVLQFIGYFCWQVIKANAIVAWEVITPGTRVNEGIVAVPATGASDAVVATLAGAISLTPGTLIIEVVRQPDTTLYVHVLHLRDIDRVRLDIFRLERGLVRAIGSPTSLRDVEQRIAELMSAHPEWSRGSRDETGATGSGADGQGGPR